MNFLCGISFEDELLLLEGLKIVKVEGDVLEELNGAGIVSSIGGASI